MLFYCMGINAVRTYVYIRADVHISCTFMFLCKCMYVHTYDTYICIIRTYVCVYLRT